MWLNALAGGMYEETLFRLEAIFHKNYNKFHVPERVISDVLSWNLAELQQSNWTSKSCP